MRAKFDNGDYRPLIEVKLTMAGVSQNVWMLIDTGADRTTIAPDLAEALTGVDFDHLGDPGPEIRGMGTAMTPSREADASLTYLGRTIDFHIWVAPTPYPVLGRIDFMRNFQCHFFWDRTPPEFSVERAPNRGKPGPAPAPNPTIRPKRKH